MNRRDKRILENFRFLLERKVTIRTLALFGSRARGDEDRDSDMDVLVVVDHLDRNTEDFISDCAWEAGFAEGVVVVPVTYTREEWEEGLDGQSLLAEAIRSEGIFL